MANFIKYLILIILFCPCLTVAQSIETQSSDNQINIIQYRDTTPPLTSALSFGLYSINKSFPLSMNYRIYSFAFEFLFDTGGYWSKPSNINYSDEYLGKPLILSIQYHLPIYHNKVFPYVSVGRRFQSLISAYDDTTIKTYKQLNYGAGISFANFGKFYYALGWNNHLKWIIYIGAYTRDKFFN